MEGACVTRAYPVSELPLISRKPLELYPSRSQMVEGMGIASSNLTHPEALRECLRKCRRFTCGYVAKDFDGVYRGGWLDPATLVPKRMHPHGTSSGIVYGAGDVL